MLFDLLMLNTNVNVNFNVYMMCQLYSTNSQYNWLNIFGETHCIYFFEVSRLMAGMDIWKLTD